jgi:hypothetical protein
MNHPPNKPLRDAAISAVREIGAPAVPKVQTALAKIIAARHNAKLTLMVLQPGSEDVYSP